MRNTFGGAFQGVGCIVYGIWGLLSLFVNLAIVINGLGWGFFGGVIAITIFPATLFLAPWYALIAWGNPIPLAITYGGFIVACIFMVIGGMISGDE